MLYSIITGILTLGPTRKCSVGRLRISGPAMLLPWLYVCVELFDNLNTYLVATGCNLCQYRSLCSSAPQHERCTLVGTSLLFSQHGVGRSLCLYCSQTTPNRGYAQLPAGDQTVVEEREGQVISKYFEAISVHPRRERSIRVRLNPRSQPSQCPTHSPLANPPFHSCGRLNSTRSHFEYRSEGKGVACLRVCVCDFGESLFRSLWVPKLPSTYHRPN